MGWAIYTKHSLGPPANLKRSWVYKFYYVYHWGWEAFYNLHNLSFQKLKDSLSKITHFYAAHNSQSQKQNYIFFQEKTSTYQKNNYHCFFIIVRYFNHLKCILFILNFIMFTSNLNHYEKPLPPIPKGYFCLGAERSSFAKLHMCTIYAVHFPDLNILINIYQTFMLFIQHISIVSELQIALLIKLGITLHSIPGQKLC